MIAPDTPTLNGLTDRITSQITGSLGVVSAVLPRSFIRVLARVLAAVTITLYKYGNFILLQQFVATASAQQVTVLGQTITPIIEWGRLIGVDDPTPATAARLLVSVTVTEQSGFVRSGAQLVGATNGVVYVVVGDVALNSPLVTVEVEAASDQQGGDGSGAIGNLANGATLSFANPLANVQREAVVASTSVQGANAEDVDTVYRQRVIDRFQLRPQGGALVDYKLWAEGVPGILNAYVYTGNPPGVVDIYSEATVASSGDPDGIPTTPQLEAVFTATQLDKDGLATRRPLGAWVNSYPITRKLFDVTVLNLNVDNPASAQSQITAAVDEYMAEREPFIEGLSLRPRVDLISAAALSGVVSVVVSAAGGTFDGVTVADGGSPVTNYNLAAGEKAKAAVVFS